MFEKGSCEAINGIKGDGVNLALDEHILILSTENLNKFTDLWDKYKIAPNSEKIAAIVSKKPQTSVSETD